LVRRTAVGVWRRTDGRPFLRGLACLLAAALVAGLGWVWWPSSDRYRPVRAWEGGTLLDAMPASSSRQLDVGSRGAVATLWPADAGPVPTADHPVLAMVLVPTAGSAADGGRAAAQAPTWVFPFNRPLPPADGNNQALAVNTEDGSVAYDVSFALVWADEDTAVNRNEAYAFANCRDCRTVAVAFQVVLLVGDVDVVVPENISAAVNYACVECVTYALATQLVVSLPGPLSDDGARDLAAIWAGLAAFGEQIEGVPLAELRDRLTEFEARILAVVREQAQAPASPDGSAATDGAAADGSGTADPSGTATPTSGAAGARTSGPAGSSGQGAATTSASPSPTSEPAATTSATAEPSATASAGPAGG
jgi:putative peptide zinc metalloprotease protein